MKILTGNQIREADRTIIEREPVSSLDLMERAATEIARWILENISSECLLVFCCGRGGNGGDGLAAARILAGAGRRCAVFLGVNPNELHADARANYELLPDTIEIIDLTVERIDPEPDAVIIDALLGIGATSEVREPLRSIIEWINALPNRVISIDVPSGMPTESDGRDSKTIVRAETTLTIEFPKLAMLLPESGECAGNVIVIPIGLDDKYIAAANTPYYYITPDWVEKLRKPRAKFSHKGNYGHALLVCGSAAMPGAAILATGGALRSGCGLVTTHIPKNERVALTASHPSAMLSLDDAECFSTPPDDIRRFSAIGVGPGLGQNAKTIAAVEKLLTMASQPDITEFYVAKSDSHIPMIIDADALNIIAENPHFKQLIPDGSILTPHPGELKRLMGDWTNDYDKLEKARKLARETRSVVIVKGAHSVICTPDGRFLFNSTGTPGMAKGGSGDVLTGLITGLAARGYDAETASIIGIYTHGRAGEMAARLCGEEATNASDLADFL